MSLDSTIRLLLVDRPQADAQPVLRPLRAAGFLVRHWQADRIDTLQHLIDEQTFDLAIVRVAEGVPPIEDVRDSIDSGFKDIPIIAVTDDATGIDAVQLLSYEWRMALGGFDVQPRTEAAAVALPALPRGRIHRRNGGRAGPSAEKKKT